MTLLWLPDIKNVIFYIKVLCREGIKIDNIMPENLCNTKNWNCDIRSYKSKNGEKSSFNGFFYFINDKKMDEVPFVFLTWKKKNLCVWQLIWQHFMFIGLPLKKLYAFPFSFDCLNVHFLFLFRVYVLYL